MVSRQCGIFSLGILKRTVLLQAQGLQLAAAVALGALIGPAQVGARMIEMATGGRHPAIWTLVTSTTLIAAGVAGMQAGLPMAAALVVYNAGNGLWSIARGAVPLALFGANRYPLVMGRLAQHALLSAAIAPSLGAVLIDRLGADNTLTSRSCRVSRNTSVSAHV